MSVQAPPAPTSTSTASSTRLRLLRPGHPGLVLAVILGVQLMVVLDATIVNIALPPIKADLGFSTADLSWVINAYTLAFGGLLLLGARAGDILGRRRTLVGGLVLFTIASFAGGLAQSSGTLLAARAVQGVGAALASPSALALLMTMFPQGRERTRAIGLYTAVSIGGSAIGLIAGGLLTEWVSWRWVMFVNVPIGALVVFIARFVLPESERSQGKFDLAGALTSTAGMTSLVFAFVHAATTSWTSPVTVGAFAAGGVLLAAFVFVERRAVMPITPLRLFADRTRNTAFLARLLLVAGVLGMFFFLSQFMQDVLDYSPVRTGFAFLPFTLMLFAASQAVSRVFAEKIDRRMLIVGGISLSTIGLGLLTQLSPSSSYLMLLGPLTLIGIGNGTAFVPLTTAALDNLEPSESGAAAGLVNVTQQLGGSLGLAILVTVFGSTSGHAARHPLAGVSALVQSRHTFTVGADHVFALATIFVAITVVLTAVAIGKARESADGLAITID